MKFSDLEKAVVDAALIRHDVMKSNIFMKTPRADAQLYEACEALRKDDRHDLRTIAAWNDTDWSAK